MRVAVDTDLLVAAHDRDDPDHAAIQGRLRELAARGGRLVLASRVLAEFYAVITDEGRAARPVTPVRAGHLCRRYLTSSEVDLLGEGGGGAVNLDRALYHASTHGVRGVRLHDLELAHALVNAPDRVDHLLTRCPARYAGVQGLRVRGLDG
ncbi:MAG: hypothetical protein HY722_15080 [Planctomycetes bacterium]|nr:hypothetical protein [Planctomycetota bacterium]